MVMKSLSKQQKDRLASSIYQYDSLVKKLSWTYIWRCKFKTRQTDVHNYNSVQSNHKCLKKMCGYNIQVKMPW